MDEQTQSQIDALFEKAVDEQNKFSKLTGQIEDVEQTTKHLINTTYRRDRRIMWLIALGIALISIGLTALSKRGDFLLGIFLSFILVAAWYGSIKANVQKEFMKQFARAHGYQFRSHGSIVGRQGSLFNVGRDRYITNYIYGAYLDQPVELFNYEYAIGQEKDKRIYYFTVFELDFPAKLSHMFLRERKSILGFDPDGVEVKIEKGHTIELEGDFNKYFTLTVQEKFEIEALQIFTPDFIAKLVDKWKHLSIEFVDDHIYIYEDELVNKRSELLAMHELACHIILKLTPVIARMGNDVEALQQHVGKSI